MVTKIKLKGFTLLELSISVAIMSLMTTVLFYNYPEASVKVGLANLVSRIATLTREAQLRGSAKDYGSGGIISGYGLYFDLTTPTSVIMFNDIASGAITNPNGILLGNGAYDSDLNEIMSTTNFSSGFSLTRLCTGAGFPIDTSIHPSACSLTSLTVSFLRPDPVARFYPNNIASLTSISGICIELISSRDPRPGHKRSVQVFNSGRIMTSNTGCAL